MTKWPSEITSAETSNSPAIHGYAKASSPFRILYVHNSADFYGASRSLLRLVSSLDKSIFDPVILLPAEGPLAEALREYGEVIVSDKISIITRKDYRFHRLPGFLFSIPGSIRFLTNLILRENIGLVHTNVGVIISSAASAFWTGRPHVWHIRDWFGEFRYIWPPFKRYITWGSSAIVTPSHDTGRQFGNCPKLRVIHNGFRLSDFPAPDPATLSAFKSKYGLQSKFVVGCVGRIKLVRKGQDTLLQAAALLKHKYPEIRYLIVGAPFKDNMAHMEELQKLIQQLNLNNEIILTGELLDPKPAYAVMDISVLPSANPEPFGGVVLESMCMGVPIIGTNIGGTPEMIEHKQTGLLFEPGNAEELAAHIEDLYLHPDRAADYSRAARQQVETRFSLRKTVNDIQSLYLEFLNSKK